MLTEDRSQKNLAAGLTRMVGQLLSEYSATTRVTTDTLLATAIASFFPQLRQFGGRTLELIIDGHVTEIVLPDASGSGMKLRENDSTIVLTKDERAIVLSLAATIAMDPDRFERFSFKGYDN
jgi:hypothetical protein